MSSIGVGKKNETFFTLEIKNNPSLQQNSTVCKFRNFSVENLIWNLIWKPRSEDNFLKTWDPLTECNYDQSFSFYAYNNTSMSTLNAIWKVLQTFTHIRTHRKYTNLANVGRMNGRKTWHLEWQTQFDEKPEPISVRWKDRKSPLQIAKTLKHSFEGDLCFLALLCLISQGLPGDC